ncbi:MAG TPA: alpha/beta hydrolase [Gammaproteobacteria bacterium]|nr:alpha/beta hydrolase [Gammaproteobacteria bacterium]
MQLPAAFSGTAADTGPEAISVNSLILHGAADAVWSPENARALERRMPAASLTLIPRTGHMAMIEKSRDFNATVLDFLGQGSNSP